MAKVDPVRRAEIGREKRARTRAQLVAAANSLYAKQAVESVTVDDVVREAGVAKGTFYVHFTGLDALNAAVAEELVRSFDELLQPVRLSLDDPALRIAFGCSSFIDKALDDARWGALTSKFLLASPRMGRGRAPTPPRGPPAAVKGLAARRGLCRAQSRDRRRDHSPADARPRPRQTVVPRSQPGRDNPAGNWS